MWKFMKRKIKFEGVGDFFVGKFEEGVFVE